MRRRSCFMLPGVILLPALATAATPRPVPVPEELELTPFSIESVASAEATAHLYFLGTRPGEPAHLWQTGGTEATTHPVWTESGDELRAARYLAASPRWMYFAATSEAEGDADALYRTDGTRVERVIDTPVLRGIEGEGRLFFTTAAETGEALWTTDGTAAGTAPTGVVLPLGTPLLSFRNTLLFAGHGPRGVEPWQTDGTPAGTHELADVVAGEGSSNPGAFAAVGDSATFFSFADATPGALWRTEGSGARAVTSIPVGLGEGPYARGAYGFARRMYVRARGTDGTWSIWASDGTPAGTAVLAHLTPEQLDAPLLGAGTHVFFLAQHASGPMLHTSDGTPSTTRPLLAAGLPVLASRGHRVYFAVDSTHLAGTDGSEVGTGSLPLPAEVGAIVPGIFEVAADTLYFTARATAATPPRLWAVDLPSVAAPTAAPAPVATTEPTAADAEAEPEGEGCDCSAKNFFSPFLGLFAYAFVRRPTRRRAIRG